jgi:hypothetical protein
VRSVQTGDIPNAWGTPLFDADRASLLTELIVGVVAEFNVDTSEMHNDSTSVSVHGQYESADGTPRRGKPTAAVTFAPLPGTTGRI